MQLSVGLRRTALAAALAMAAGVANAQEWPNRPIRIMVGFGAGGGTDVVTRIVAEPLADLLGQRVIVENKPGAGGTLAGDVIAKGSRDGYDALMISAGHTVSAVMIKAQNYDAVKDFTPVGVVPYAPLVYGVPILPGSVTLPGYYGTSHAYSYDGPYYGGPYTPYWSRLPYAGGVFGYR